MYKYNNLYVWTQTEISPYIKIGITVYVIHNSVDEKFYLLLV